MAEVTLQAETGRLSGTRASRRLRRSGMVPGIVYGHGIEPIEVAVDHHDLLVAFHTDAGRNVLINLEMKGGSSLLTMARAIDKHPYRNQIRHVDFVTVSLTEKVRAAVAIHLEGEPVGVKEGGVLTPGIASVEIEALPTAIPSAITVDVSALAVGDLLRVSDLAATEGVDYLTDPEEVVVSVTVPAAEPEPEPVEAEEEAEVEEGEEAAAEAGEPAATEPEEQNE